MKLITETVENITFVKEDVNGAPGGNYFIEGIFLQANRQNKNGRFYPTEIMQREVARYNKDYVNANRALGELGHPENPSVNLHRASHKIVSLVQDGDNFVGRAKILDTPHGRIAKNLMDEQIKLGVSSRGLGTVKKNFQGIDMIQDDFHLATAADIVYDPSAPDAFVRGIMEEKEWILVEGKGWIEQFVETSQEKIEESVKKDAETRQKISIELFESFLQKLGNHK